jgi:membrane dipeptidase
MGKVVSVVGHARELHRNAIIIDGHCDILMPIADGKMRLGERVALPDPATWRPPQGMVTEPESAMYGFSPHTAYFGTMGLYDIPRLLEGGVTAIGFGIYIENKDLNRSLQRGLDMVYWLKREAAENPRFEQVTSVEDIRRLKREGKTGGILALEGFEALGTELRYLDLYYDMGLRIASLTHSRRNIFADGHQADTRTGGLTALGRQAVRRMNELGIVVDLGHLNQTGQWEVLELSTAPVIMSHCGVRRLFPLDATGRSPEVARGRERLDALAKNGGVLGVIFYSAADVGDVVADIEYVFDTIGPDHVGLGSDLYGIEKSPKGLEDISRLPALTEALVRRGHADETIVKVLGGNYLRVFEKVWK